MSAITWAQTTVTWKSTVSNAVNALWNQEAKECALPKSSLKYLNIDSLEIGVVHPVWSTLTGNPREIERVAVKARLLTGTYVLQANRAKFNQFNVNPTCKICGEEAEDRLHFILRCKALEANRRHHIKKICNILNESYSSDTVHNIVSNQLIMLQVILDCTHKSLQSMVVTPQISTREGKKVPATIFFLFTWVHLYKIGSVYIKYEPLSFIPCNMDSVARLVAIRH